jgi:hypothetical protein
MARDVAMRDDGVGAVHLPLPAFTARLAHGPGQKEHAIDAGKAIRFPPGSRADLRATFFPRTIRLPPTGSAHAMIVRIHTGDDGQTHFEDIPPPADQSVALPPAGNLVFRTFPADYFSDWHNAPRRQYIFILSGQVEIGIGDGTTRRFGPGDAILADDLTGQGHTTRSLGVPRVSATVAVAV